jgi:hypothetical protein
MVLLAAVLLALAVTAVLAVVGYRAGDVMLAAPTLSYASGDYLRFSNELAVIVSPLKDGALPVLSM